MEHDPLIGRQLGAYLIQHRLGEGGMARVYKAYHARLRRDVAIKVILPQVADKPGFRERFEREAQVVASLEHRNIVAVYDFGETEALTYLVMQYIGGGTLRDQIHQQGRISQQQAVQYAIQMARALHHAHQRGIIHRDVKPQNMLISSNNPGELLLSDFGIAKIFDQEHTLPAGAERIPADAAMTSADQLVGTAQYMAPEQIKRQPVDARTDVYALGIVLFQMLTGQAPFSSTTTHGLLYQHVHTPPRSVRELNPQIPQSLELIVAKALSKSSEQRYQSAEAMAQALEAVFSPGSLQQADHYATDKGFPETTQSNIQTAISSSTPYVVPSYYGQTPSLSPYVQQSQYGTVPAQPPIHPVTNPGAITSTPKIKARTRRKIPLSTYMGIGLLLLAIIFFVSKTNLFPMILPGPTHGQQAQTFTDDFTDNHNNWPQTSSNGLTAMIENGHYSLTVADGNTYFPHPASSGTLPDNFTLSAQMAENSGPNAQYGIAFHFKEESQGVSCYAFVIDNNGTYQLLKYTPDQSQPQSLWSKTTTIINTHQSNTIQVVARDHSYTFSINGKTILVGKSQSLTDTDYTGGTIALFISGPHTSFTVTRVQLTVS